MKLQTAIPLKPQQHNQIDYNSKIVLIGSCFAENIGYKLDYFKFQNLQNPFGILFQPVAIENLITQAINEKKFTEEDIFFQNEQWHCFDAHSKLSAPSKEALIDNLNINIKLANQQITQSTHVIITLGTAWVYRHLETDAVVANCHKVQQKQFVKELRSLDEISETLEAIASLIKSVNPDVSIILTISPVRHLKDGFVENTQSKAHLISAIHQVVEPRNSLYYFPSYEIMMDELRDYRFYGEDMIHPSQTAIDYIWEKFKDVWISEEAHKTMEAVEVVQKGLRHKPFNVNSEGHQEFLKNLKENQLKLQSQYSHITF
jgi:lysophospholipase L1-like esterase